MSVSIAICILGLGATCWMLFPLAVYALPVWLATMSGLYLHGAGFGTVAAPAGGILVGAALVLAGQVAFATIRSVHLRLAIGSFMRHRPPSRGFMRLPAWRDLRAQPKDRRWSSPFRVPRSSEVRPG